jgi:uncharacterized protein HemX
MTASHKKHDKSEEHPDTDEHAHADTPAKKTRKQSLIPLLVAVAVIIIAAIGGMAYAQSQKTKSRESDNNPSTQTAPAADTSHSTKESGTIEKPRTDSNSPDGQHQESAEEDETYEEPEQ